MRDDICENNHGGNAESVEAFLSTSKEGRETVRLRILEWLNSKGNEGGTCDEACYALGIAHQSCSARFSELKRDARIMATPNKRKTVLGRNARVFVRV